MAPQGVTQHVEARPIARLHGFAVQNSCDVALQSLNRRIALRRLFAQGLSDDRVEVAADRTGWNWRIRARRRSTARKRSRAAQDRSQRLKRGGIDTHPWVLTREQLEQQQTERIDIRRGRDRAASQLLGRCAA